MVVLFGLLAAEAVSAILYAPAFVWNEIRLSRSIALLHGIGLYPGRDTAGPLIGTLHTPVGHCLYLAVAGLHSPTGLLLAGSAWSMLLVFAPLGWVLWRASEGPGERFLHAASAFLFCGFLILQAPGTLHIASMIHIDAPAVAFCTIACGLLCNPRKAIAVPQVWLSGLAGALAVGSKQTAAPVILAIALFIAVSAGVRLVGHFVAAVMAGGAVLFAAILAFVPAQDFLFNTVTLAAHRPLKPDYIALLVNYFRVGKLDALCALFPVVLLGGLSCGASRQPRSWRAFFLENRWLVFAMGAAAILPVTVKALVVMGSDVNHVGLVLYLLFVAAALAIEQGMADAARSFLRQAAWLCAALGILVNLAPGVLLSLPARVRNVRSSDPEAAYRYELRHPGRAYFPCDPMASLLTSGKAYHVDYSVDDREIGGYPLTAAQFLGGLPPAFELIAIPPGQAPRSAALRGMLASFARGADPELPGWTVYRRR